jgi:hypothetical protein
VNGRFGAGVSATKKMARWLLNRRLGKASGRRVPVDRADEVEALYRTRYAGFTAKHFHEHLVKDHGFNWGYSWTKTFLQSKGLLEKARRRGAHRRKRPRRPLPGMLGHGGMPRSDPIRDVALRMPATAFHRLPVKRAVVRCRVGVNCDRRCPKWLN